jgi:hypothetical protein
MASYVPNSFKGRLMGDTAQISTAINLATDTVKLMLLTSSHTPDVDAEVFIDDVSANEISASGSYSAGGVTLTKSSSTDDTDDEGVFDATDVSITSATISARYAAIYKDTGTPSTSPIICVIDFGSTQTSTGGTFAITFAAEGILNLG